MRVHRRGRGPINFCGCIAALLAALLACAALVRAEDGADSRLLSDIRYLASDALEGRGIGTPGLEKAAEFVRSNFEAAGLAVPPNGQGAFQQFTMTSGAELGTPNELTFVGPDGDTMTLNYDADFRTCSIGGSGAFEGEIVFCGYGIDSKEKLYREFEEVDLRGRVALIMRRAPQQGNSASPFAAPHGDVSREGSLSAKISNAVTRGAAAVILVNDPYTVRKNAQDDRALVSKARDAIVVAAQEWASVDRKNQEQVEEARKKLTDAIARLEAMQAEAAKPDNDPLIDFGYGGRGKQDAIPVMHISVAACNRLLKSAMQRSLEEIETEIDRNMKPQSKLLEGYQARGAATIKLLRADVKNVVAVLEGEGPLADETIVIGAHYDHLGLGGTGSLSPGSTEVHNGADDNASGTVGLLELARRLAARSQTEKFPRRIVFIAFTGEEMGLFGSDYYVKHPFFPLDKTIAMFNLDMVGRLKDDKLTVFGTGTSSHWKDQLEELAKARGFKLFPKPEGFGPSDQSSFYNVKIPVLHFFTGSHADYHRPTDDWEKINVPGMARVIDLIEEMVVSTAKNPERPDYVLVQSESTQPRTGSRPYFGSIPNFASETAGYSISGVSPGSPAAEGGLQGGDTIIEFGGRKITSLDDFDLALRNFGAGDEVTVVVQREDKKLTLKVTLGKPR